MIKVNEFFAKQVSDGFAKIIEVSIVDTKKQIEKGSHVMNWERWSNERGLGELGIKEWKVALALDGATIGLRIMLWVRGNIKLSQ